MTNVKRDETNGITLLPCPFCGGEAETVGDDILGWMAECMKCGVSTRTCCITEAEAIAAWNARAEHGTLTAEQVRKAIERNFGKVAVLDDGGPVEWRDDWVCNIGINYKAIADELNTRAERTCHMEYQTDGSQRGWWKCSECGKAMDTIDACAGKKPPSWCGNCGAKVVDA